MRSLSFILAVALMTLGCSDGNNATNADNTNNGSTNNGSTNNGTTGTNSSTNSEAADVGKRCTDSDDCAGDLRCFTEFFGERPVCTRECGAAHPCPGEAECVGGILNYNDLALSPWCVQPCEDDDCESLGSECDTHAPPNGVTYCF